MSNSVKKRNIRLVIAYKGTHYAGWQIQKNAITVEATVKAAIKKVTGEDTTVYGAGRTDAGVHALGQTANFFTDSSIPAERFAPALNANLPGDIRIVASEQVSETFHSRFCAKGKIYSYRIDTGEVYNPLFSDLAWHLRYPLNIDKMIAASRCLIGEHDFRCFMASGSSVKDTVRTIEAIDIKEQDQFIILTFKGDGFLYHMVRIIVGTLSEIGMGMREVDEMPSILALRDRLKAGKTAPAKGLIMEKVIYESDE